MEEPKRLSDILHDAMNAHDFTVEKLASTTGVSEQWIRALANNEPHVVPPSTYARGYINKMARALDVRPEELWTAYEREYQPKHSGAADLMPQNRFAITGTNKKLIAGIVIGAIICVYTLASLNRLIGAPHLTLTSPKETVVTSQASAIIVKGVVQNPKDTLTVNDVGIAVDKDGFFEHEFALDPGTNTFVIVAKRFLGRTASETIQVNYEPVEPTASPPPRATSTPRSM